MEGGGLSKRRRGVSFKGWALLRREMEDVTAVFGGGGENAGKGDEYVSYKMF
jgi:hypothetical protein